MAVVHVREITGRGGERDVKSRKRYTRVFQILTDDPTDGTKVVLADPNLPNYGDTWEQVTANVVTDSDTTAFCVEKRATQGDGENHLNWMVTCEYVGVGDPTLEPPKVSWSVEKYQETTQTDANGNLVANSAGDPYQSGLTSDRRRLVLNIERNVLTWDAAAKAAFTDTLNETTILATRHPPGFGPQLAKMENIGAEPVYYENYPVSTDVHYWREKIQIVIDLNGWEAEILDAGFHKLVVVGGVTKKVKIIDAAGGYPSTPRPLDGSGGELSATGTPQYRTFIRYLPADWSALNINY